MTSTRAPVVRAEGMESLVAASESLHRVRNYYADVRAHVGVRQCRLKVRAIAKIPTLSTTRRALGPRVRPSCVRI
jgi:hypothetical protein